MSQQIQYNYYNTVATKIGDNTFIFRGKRNVPNLVLQNSDSYISTKLTIHPSSGTIEIEHEPITNYSKRVIATFPVNLNIDIASGASKEINLNALISKSIRFATNETDDEIRLSPETGSTVEGFCSSKDAKKMKRDLKEQVAKQLAAHEKTPHGAVGNLSDDDLKYLAGRISAISSSANDVNTANGDWECTPFNDSTDSEMTVVGKSVPLSELDSEKAAENSVYHKAAVHVIIFVVVLFGSAKLLGFLYSYAAIKLGSSAKLSAAELLITFVLIILIVTLFVAQTPPKSASDTATKQKNANMSYAGSAFGMILIFLVFFVWGYRRSLYNEAKASGDSKQLENVITTIGNRDYGVIKFFIAGLNGLGDLYRWMFPPKS